MEQEFMIRRMEMKDLDDIEEVEQLSFPTPWSRESFINELKNNVFARYFVIEKDKRVIGYGGMWLVLDEAHITNIAIHPDYRGLRLGERLMRRLMGLAIRSGAASMTLEVRKSNEVAQRLYRKLGFVEEGVRPGYYTDNGEDAIIMWATLKENVCETETFDL
ncbi:MULTISPECIES: ribosomal protein S18-alanine N-acetyltransferase [Aneurinibacillus]|uniref:Ribosomal protein S18-alanine N-acetyltransferase n=1 Tax=Aneurinibacillus thermoaerophilus TaxID=143495 RepID=A0ABX8YDK9_ANETH|nr:MULTISPECIES: ribosomal protein S18-alanine N-acetyltransferase [Aneurinibacillus]AMA74244.1 ribosomal-protein-alanine acetyltransferase [Aneurinibacillus sp. XH2]MED0676757.1 ribosomal protein S18-alanine N-acetyltransferase [Aneurinibacillus thermoaerophilus]MED0738616.1 ribosomal protein S18-alanine N-acetyltransferase [Aneurinibacillus thermoaerophilus]MED0758741.1 ribosomal protein S18-alanine N-acetyltransferase [Aneurinibacillus thermoaerophilus]MED0760579.1 ribosomal protein S18-ala